MLDKTSRQKQSNKKFIPCSNPEPHKAIDPAIGLLQIRTWVQNTMPLHPNLQ